MKEEDGLENKHSPVPQASTGNHKVRHICISSKLACIVAFLFSDSKIQVTSKLRYRQRSADRGKAFSRIEHAWLKGTILFQKFLKE